QRRMGISDEFITRAMIEKLEINKSRQWPEPKEGEPRLHIKEQPATVVPEEMPKGLADQIVSLLAYNIGDKFLAQKIWNACRAALLQDGFRDLSQPVDPQIAKYEQIMLQAGWVMVPVEPTDEMIAAAMNCDDVVFDSTDPTAFCVQFREIYYSMVTAAPKPEINNE
ncbi:dATP/dGTP pyrophosphohydrolase domain-containing protein, partial [Salmonella enterica]|uniref:dATP/dGTP pyrophosphohydrolase domain-containing protein n=1 Tax=Salmonella enterica TaxID=28901 RepID=UPI003455516A